MKVISTIKTRGLLVGLLAVHLMFTTYSCDTCLGRIIAELSLKIVSESLIDVALGNPFVLTSIVQNTFSVLSNIPDCDELGAASESRTRMEIDYDDNGYWSNVYDDDITTSALGPNEFTSIAREITFNQPGRFRIRKIADFFNEVDEFSNTNNTNIVTVGPRSNADQEFDQLIQQGFIIVEVKESYPGQKERLAHLPIVQVNPI